VGLGEMASSSLRLASPHRYHGFCCDCVYSQLCVIYSQVRLRCCTHVARRNPAIEVVEWD
jgi:hypothetical protein